LGILCGQNDGYYLTSAQRLVRTKTLQSFFVSEENFKNGQHYFLYIRLADWEENMD